MVIKLQSCLLAAVLLTVVSCASKQKEMNKKAELHFNAGTQSLMTGDYTEALTHLIKANEIENNNSEVLNNLGMAYYFKGDSTLALKCLNKSLELDPKNSDARSNIASILYENNRTSEAESMYKEVLRDLTYDKQARTYYNLGILELERKGNEIQAEKYFLTALKETQDYCPAHFKLGMIYYGKRQYQKAFSSFREATMGTCLNSASAHYQQALSLIGMRKINDARIKLDEIQNRFARTPFAAKAKVKMLELDETEKNYGTIEARSSRKVIHSPEF